MSKGRSINYYSLDKIHAAAPPDDYYCYFIFGGRQIGKTFGVQKKCIEEFLQEGREILWFRMKKSIQKDTPMVQQWCADGQAHGWIPEEFTAIGNAVYDDVKGGTRVCTFGALSRYDDFRGPAYPLVGNMVIDELIPETGGYPAGIGQAMKSLTRTIVKGRWPFKFYALSNYISITNPHFAAMKIAPKNKLDVTVFPEKETAIEICRGYEQHRNPDGHCEGFLASFGGNEYEIPLDPMASLIRSPRGFDAGFYLRTSNNRNITLYRDGGLFYWSAEAAPRNASQSIINPALIGEDVTLITSSERRALKDALGRGMMRFSTANVMFDIVEDLNVI